MNIGGSALEKLKQYHLFIDDTGSRQPDQQPQPRKDGMDCFGLGGVLIKEEDSAAIGDALNKFRDKWNLDKPLHSTKIRGRRGPFAWLGREELAAEAARFYSDLNNLLLSQPMLGIAAIIDRPGYVARYSDLHKDNIWLMDKTAYAIVVERALKFSISQGRALQVYYESAGKREDTDIRSFHRDLRAVGMPFDSGSSSGYEGLGVEDFEKYLISEPLERTKKTPVMQLADLFLYPMAKAGYDPLYEPYREMIARGRVVYHDQPDDVRARIGIKYSCFDVTRNV